MLKDGIGTLLRLLLESRGVGLRLHTIRRGRIIFKRKGKRRRVGKDRDGDCRFYDSGTLGKDKRELIPASESDKWIVKGGTTLRVVVRHLSKLSRPEAFRKYSIMCCYRTLPAFFQYLNPFDQRCEPS